MRSRCLSAALATLALGAGLLSTSEAAAQTTRDNQIWAASFTQLKLTGRDSGATSGLSLWLDVHARRTGAAYVSILRPALGYRFGSMASAWAGYAAVATLDDTTRDWVLEQRAWQQGLFTFTVADRVTFQLRPRLEQRFREGEDDVAWRARAFVRTNVAFGPKIPVLVATWVEPFFHLNDVSWGPATGFDQNRTFLGFGVKGPGSTRVEIGYLNVTTSRPTGLAIAHNLSLNAFSEF
ncbi:MAG: DUF2490 domain-containing protein [Deltaproteobacteria bacterium]|nr:DUF2490 domain-containing protein [Deltaproteobacteria bacterium]